ncbi:MAG: two-component system response regulator [Caulobacteraceae bacterium]|nr:two-component system response regulator [Caulobacteraceae bacterium]
MNLLSRIFQGFGVRDPYRCYTAARAMEVCEEADLDLVVCDGSLKDGQAYDFVAALRRSDLAPNRFAPVMVVAGHTPLDQVQKARDCGANFVVTKPVTPRTLLERVLWVAQEARAFVELDGYVGPDRRFHNLGPPEGTGAGRRRSDAAVEAAAPPVAPIDPEESLL